MIFSLFAFFCQLINQTQPFNSLYHLKESAYQKANLVFMHLNPPINVFSNTLACSTSLGRAIKHLL